MVEQFDDAGGALEELRKDLNAAQEVIFKNLENVVKQSLSAPVEKLY